MARYREKILSTKQTVIFLLLAFITVLAPWQLGEQELSWREGFVIAQSLGIKFTPLPLVTVHGEAIPNAYPLLPMLAKLITLMGCPLEICTRILSLTALLALSVLTFIVTRNTSKSVSAGACAGAMTFSCLLALDKSSVGLVNMLAVLVIFSGHLIWYYYAAVRGDWQRAHIAGFAACSLGFYLSGITAIFMFLIPLIFMRRPLGIFRRLNSRWLLLGLGLLLLTVLVWYLPYHTDKVRIALRYPQAAFLDNRNYLEHLLTFIPDMLMRLFPWVILAWAPFCVAFQTLDATPLFSRFLRTLVLANFFLLWLMPLDEIYWCFVLLPPMAVLTGLYYPLTIRRYGNIYRKLFNISAAILLPGAAVILILFFAMPSELTAELLKLERPLIYSDNFGETLLAYTAAAMLLILAVLLWRLREKPPVWCYMLLIIIAPMMVFNCIVRPYQAMEHPRRDNADMFSRALQQEPSGATGVIYKYMTGDFYAQSVYMKRQVININSMNELPTAEVPVVYMLAENYPACNNRTWRSLLPEAETIRGRKINIWRGQWQSQESAAPRNSSLLEGLPPLPDTEVKP